MIVGIVGFFLLWLLVELPRGRETSRLTVCQRNMMQIGVGLQLYHQANRHYPTISTLGDSVVDSPIKAMLDGLALPDLVGLQDPTRPPKPLSSPPRGSRIPGITCPSDIDSVDRRLDPLISYRANTGDTASGRGGPFEPGRVVTSAQVEAADGLAFTAGFAERLVGDGRDRHPAPANYATTPGPVGDEGCPSLIDDHWRGDAGSNWAEAGWRSTVYSHVLPPNGGPSCIAIDGRTAAIGASSAHPRRINVLMLDGALRGVTPTVDLKIWRAMGTVGP